METGDRLADRELPVADTEDPAQLEAFYGNYGVGENLRKVCLSNCKKCGRAVIQSPMSPKVKLCDGCDKWPIDCDCEPLKPDTDADFLARLREAYNR